MSVGLVYLRPKQITCTRVSGNGTVAARTAWQRIEAWLQRNAISGLVITRYGLEFGPAMTESYHGNSYIACVEIDGIRKLPPLDDCPFDRLPGGAFARSRFVGPCAEISAAFASIQSHLAGTNHYAADRSRPLITIFLDPPDFSAPTTVKTDLLIPVATQSRNAA
ncbi:GyrI-like domain-containing protein [Filomicrobium sp.]|uniref:GyrI-like domain-containing protein n=1 Tax=Filomicrobium sp. TaxID=2024831 RepID=UPI00258BB691|nr:GyrI-like domain-containing protein [Filomicrobium sp.]MCV0369107.1 GyrI-like domain-containing protein [Filomicrobium sp.]